MNEVPLYHERFSLWTVQGVVPTATERGFGFMVQSFEFRVSGVGFGV